MLRTGKYRLSIDNQDIFSLDYKEKEKEKSKVCFLSGSERKLLSGGHSRLDCEYNKEYRKIGPGTYKTEKLTSSLYQTLNKVTSKLGYGGLASRTSRFIEERGDFITTVMPEAKTFHKNCLIDVPKLKIGMAPVSPPPFNSAVPRKTGAGKHKEDTPGFNYNITKRVHDNEMPFDHSFGGQTRLRPHVVIKCTPENLDMCSLCESKPVGDYWFYGCDFLCRPCYDNEWNKPNKYTRKKLEDFKKIRDCTNIHQHEGTNAAYPLMSDKAIKMQQILECYFACYQGPRKIINTEPNGQTEQSQCQFRKIGRTKTKSHIQVLFENPKNKSPNSL